MFVSVIESISFVPDRDRHTMNQGVLGQSLYFNCAADLTRSFRAVVTETQDQAIDILCERAGEYVINKSENNLDPKDFIVSIRFFETIDNSFPLGMNQGTSSGTYPAK